MLKELIARARKILLPDPKISDRKNLVREIKRFEARLGFKPTKNFLKYSDKLLGYQRTYYTRKTDVLSSHEELKSDTVGFIPHFAGSIPSIPLGTNEDDCDVYCFDAYISGADMPMTPNLIDSSLEEFIAIVLHEDFHEQSNGLPVRINEAAAALISFAGGTDFAAMRFGENSLPARRMRLDAKTFWSLACRMNQLFELLEQRRKDFENRLLTKEGFMAARAYIYEAMRARCRKASVRASAFSLYPPHEANNAWLAVHMTYFKYYPLIYELYEALDHNTKNTAQVLITIGRLMPNEQTAVSAIKHVIAIKRTLGSGSETP